MSTIAETRGPTNSSTPSPLTAEEYIEKHELQLYLKDVVKLVLGRREERPISIVYEYFKSVRAGDHVASRGYEYVFASQRNRLAFLRHFQKCYPNLSDSERITPADYHQLLTFLCPDFPKEIVDESLLGVSESQLVFGTVSAMVQTFFFYKEFFYEARALFTTLANVLKNSNDEKSLVVPVGDFVTSLRMACYGKEDMSSSSAVVLALGQSHERRKKNSTAYPPIEIVCAALFKKCAASNNTLNALLFGKTEAGKDNMFDCNSKEKVIARWDQSPLTWTMVLHCILQEKMIIEPLRNGSSRTIPPTNLIDAGIFPRKKDEKRSALAKTLLTQLANEPSSPGRASNRASSGSNDRSGTSSGSSHGEGKRRRRKSKSRHH